MSKELAASGQLSAEDIERIRSVLTGNRIQAYKAGEQGVADVMTRIIDFQFNTLCDMALSSLRGTFADGIEAAAKLIRKRLDGIYEDHSYTEQDTGAVVIDNAEIEGRANELEELEEEIRALAQGQWSKSTVSTSHVTGETQQDAEPADHPTEQDADELLRVEHDFRIAPEELTRIRNNGCGNDWPKVWNVQLNELCDAYRELRRIDAHLARKEQA